MPPKRSSSRLARAARPPTSSPKPTDENPSVLISGKDSVATSAARPTRKPLSVLYAAPQTRTASKLGPSRDRKTRSAAGTGAASRMSHLLPVTGQRGVLAPDSDEPDYVDLAQSQSQAQSTAQHGLAKQTKVLSDHPTDIASSHGSSDKENIPPAAQYPNAQQGAPLDTLFPTESVASQQISDSYGSPGVARRVSVIDERLQAYQDLGVDKVRAWKAAKHDQAAPPPAAEADVSTESITGFQTTSLDDEFGFMDAERKVKLRRNDVQSSELESTFGPSEDNLLADQVFNMSSSPPPPSLHVKTDSTDSISDVQTTPIPSPEVRRTARRKRRVDSISFDSSPREENTKTANKLRMVDALSLLPRRNAVKTKAKPRKGKAKRSAAAKAVPSTTGKGKQRAVPSSSPPPSSPNSDKIRRIEQYEAAQKYKLETELVL